VIKAVVFDFWRTLVPATIDFVHLESLLKKSNSNLDKFIPKYEGAVQLKKYSSFDQLRKDFFGAFKEENNNVLEQELYEIYVNRFDKINFFPDVVPCLSKLRSQGYKLGLLSNMESLGAKEAEEKLRLKEYFDALCYSYEIGVLKPDKKAFLYALKKLGVKPSEALMVGDSLRSDIAGAQGTGMHTCWLNRTGKIIDAAYAKPEFEITSLDYIYRVLGVLNA